MRYKAVFTIKFRTFSHRFEIPVSVVQLWAQSGIRSNVATAKNQIRKFIRDLPRTSTDIAESLDDYVLRNIIDEISKRYKQKESVLLTTIPPTFINDKDIEDDIWLLVCSGLGAFGRREDGIYCPCGENESPVFVYRIHSALVAPRYKTHLVIEVEHQSQTVYIEYNTAVVSNQSIRDIVKRGIEKKLAGNKVG